MIIFDVYYDYFLLELFSLMPTMIIFDTIYDDICRFSVYVMYIFISHFFRDLYNKYKTNGFNWTKSKQA